jgi:hypothetical protein
MGIISHRYGCDQPQAKLNLVIDGQRCGWCPLAGPRASVPTRKRSTEGSDSLGCVSAYYNDISRSSDCSGVLSERRKRPKVIAISRIFSGTIGTPARRK